MGWYVCIKTIKGRRYYYRQRTWREGHKVRCESIYIGPVAGTLGTPLFPDLVDPREATPRGRPARVGQQEGEAAFIADLLSGIGAPRRGQKWAPNYDWEKAQPEEMPFTITDTGILEIGLRMGVKMVTGVEPQPPRFNAYVNTIVIPDARRYRSHFGCSAERLLYVDILHECAHATFRRFNRDLGHSDLAKYAFEEVVAELAANIAALRLGVAPEDPTLSRLYLAAWGEKVRNPKLAVARALEAAAYLVSLHPRGQSQKAATCTAALDVV